MPYNDFINSLATNRGGNYSRGSLVDLAVAMFNDSPSFTIYTKKGDTYVENVVNPGQSVRQNVIAPVLKAFGVDKAEMGKLEDVKINKAGGDALADFATMLVKEYVSERGLGRRLTLPMTHTDEAVMTLSERAVAEDTKKTTMIVKNADGSYEAKPTGKVVTTKGHQKMIVTNRIPGWLKVSKDAK